MFQIVNVMVTTLMQV